MPVGVCLSNQHGTIIYSNPSFEEMFGYGPGDLIGKHVMSLNGYSAEEADQWVGKVADQLHVLKAWVGDFTSQKKNGDSFNSHVRVAAAEISGQSCLVFVQEEVLGGKQS